MIVKTLRRFVAVADAGSRVTLHRLHIVKWPDFSVPAPGLKVKCLQRSLLSVAPVTPLVNWKYITDNINQRPGTETSKWVQLQPRDTLNTILNVSMQYTVTL